MTALKTRKLVARDEAERDHLFLVAKNSGYRRWTAKKIVITDVLFGSGKKTECYEVIWWA